MPNLCRSTVCIQPKKALSLVAKKKKGSSFMKVTAYINKGANSKLSNKEVISSYLLYS